MGRGCPGRCVDRGSACDLAVTRDFHNIGYQRLSVMTKAEESDRPFEWADNWLREEFK